MTDPVPDGYREISSVVPIDRLVLTIPSAPSTRAGRRDLLSLPEVIILTRDYLQPLVTSVLGEGAFPVGATLFAKEQARNWKVSWHQDTSVPAVPPGIPTKLKDGIPHVQPGVELLRQLLAVRLHLDDAGPENGGLWVVPRSHELGVIPEVSIPSVVSELGSVPAAAPRGSVLLMRPLLLHSSRSAAAPHPRRVLHVLFAPAALVSYGWFAVR